MNWLELELANRAGLDIPAGSILTFEQLSPGKIDQWPDAKCFIRFDYGLGMMQEALNTSYEELERLVLRDNPNVFVKLTNLDDTPIHVRKDGIVSMKGVKLTDEELKEFPKPDEMKHARCQIALRLGHQITGIFVREENRGIKILTGEKSPARQVPPAEG